MCLQVDVWWLRSGAIVESEVEVHFSVSNFYEKAVTICHTDTLWLVPCCFVVFL